MNHDASENANRQRRVRVLIADDHFIVRQGVRALLAGEPGCEIVGEAVNGRDAVEKVSALQPDVVIIDIRMPELNGTDASRQIRHARPETQVVALTIDDCDDIVQDLLRAGVLGFVLKTDCARDLVAAVHAVADGRPFFTSRVARMVLRGYLDTAVAKQTPLTPRERETVQLLAEGRSNKEVANALGISVKTAETHRAHVMRALELHSISDLVHYAVRQNIIEA